MTHILESSRTRNRECLCDAEFVQTLTQASEAVSGQWIPGECDRCAKSRAHEKHIAVTAKIDQVIPALFAGITFDSLKEHGTEQERERQRRVFRQARAIVELWPQREDLPTVVPQIVAMFGPPGTGKTSVCCAIARDLIQQNDANVLICKFSDFVRDLRDGWNQAEERPESERLERYRTADLLVLDEVSRHAFLGAPESKQAHLYDCVGWREEQMLPTILTTNETREGIEALLGKALVSRINRYDGFWHYGWGDYRRLFQKAWEQRAAGSPPV